MILKARKGDDDELAKLASYRLEFKCNTLHSPKRTHGFYALLANPNDSDHPRGRRSPSVCVRTPPGAHSVQAGGAADRLRMECL